MNWLLPIFAYAVVAWAKIGSDWVTKNWITAGTLLMAWALAQNSYWEPWSAILCEHQCINPFSPQKDDILEQPSHYIISNQSVLWILQDKQVRFSNEEGFQIVVTSLCWEVFENAIIFNYVSWHKFNTTRIKAVCSCLCSRAAAN